MAPPLKKTVFRRTACIRQRGSMRFSQESVTRQSVSRRIVKVIVEELGADTYVYGQLAGDEPEAKPFIVRHSGRVEPAIGDVFSLAVRAGAEHIFHPDTGARVV